MFRSTTIVKELTLSLAKVTCIKLVKVRRYGSWGGVAEFNIKSMVVCVLCAVRSDTLLHSTQHTHHHGLDIKFCHTTA
jgi:hypothetical protein